MKISEWIKAHAESGEFDGEPYIAVPNMPGREPFTAEEIVEALKNEDIARRQGNEHRREKRSQ